jgi:hypothetical protein
MDSDAFNRLTLEQQWSLVVGIAVRNALEPFHEGKGLLPDAVMPQLNRRVRRAILISTYSMMHLGKPGCRKNVESLIAEVPNYWEIPDILPEEHDYFEHGPSLAWSDVFTEKKDKAETWYKTGKLADSGS